MQCSGNSKTVNHKKSQSRGASIEHDSRSVSSCSPLKDLTTADTYGFRPSQKNLEKLDLMPENELERADNV